MLNSDIFMQFNLLLISLKKKIQILHTYLSTYKIKMFCSQPSNSVFLLQFWVFSQVEIAIIAKSQEFKVCETLDRGLRWICKTTNI